GLPVNLYAARGSVRVSARGNGLPIGVALGHVRVITGGVGAVVPSLGGGSRAVVGVAVRRIHLIKPATRKSIPAEAAKSVEAAAAKAAKSVVKTAAIKSGSCGREPAAVEPAGSAATEAAASDMKPAAAAKT